MTIKSCIILSFAMLALVGPHRALAVVTLSDALVLAAWAFDLAVRRGRRLPSLDR